MSADQERQHKKELSRAWKEKRRAEGLQGVPLPPDKMDALFVMLDEALAHLRKRSGRN